MKKRVIVNRLLTLAAVAALSAATAGCAKTAAGAPQSGEEAQGPVQLTYWYSWKDKIAENNTERIQEFNDTVGKEKGIVVTAEYQGTYEELHSKLKSAFVAGEEPDVCVMEIASIQTFAEGGIIQPIGEFMDQEDVADFYPGLMENCYVNRTLYGIPYLRSTPVLYYNKTLFEKAGLDPEQGPADWKELAEMSKKLETAGAAGYGFISDVWHYEALIRCNGGDTVNGDWTQATFNSPQGVELAEYLKKGIGDSNFKYYSGAATAAGDVLSTDVVNQKTAMWIASTAGLTNNMQLASDNGYEIGTAFIPKNTQNKVPTGGCNLVMTSRLEGREREAAAELIKFMTSKDSAVKNHIKTGYLPTRQSISTDERLLALYKETPQYQVALDQLKYGSGRPMAQGYMESAKVYTEAMDKIMSSDADIQAVLDQAAEDCNVLLK